MKTFYFALGIEQISKASWSVAVSNLFGWFLYGADFTTLTNCHKSLGLSKKECVLGLLHDACIYAMINFLTLVKKNALSTPPPPPEKKKKGDI